MQVELASMSNFSFDDLLSAYEPPGYLQTDYNGSLPSHVLVGQRHSGKSRQMRELLHHYTQDWKLRFGKDVKPEDIFFYKEPQNNDLRADPKDDDDSTPPPLVSAPATPEPQLLPEDAIISRQSRKRKGREEDEIVEEEPKRQRGGLVATMIERIQQGLKRKAEDMSITENEVDVPPEKKRPRGIISRMVDTIRVGRKRKEAPSGDDADKGDGEEEGGGALENKRQKSTEEDSILAVVEDKADEIPTTSEAPVEQRLITKTKVNNIDSLIVPGETLTPTQAALNMLMGETPPSTSPFISSFWSSWFIFMGSSGLRYSN
jgi:hypothetical protein